MAAFHLSKTSRNPDGPGGIGVFIHVAIETLNERHLQCQALFIWQAHRVVQQRFGQPNGRAAFIPSQPERAQHIPPESVKASGVLNCLPSNSDTKSPNVDQT